MAYPTGAAPAHPTLADRRYCYRASAQRICRKSPIPQALYDEKGSPRTPPCEPLATAGFRPPAAEQAYEPGHRESRVVHDEHKHPKPRRERARPACQWLGSPELLISFSGVRTERESIPGGTIFDDLMKRGTWYLPRGSKHLVPGATVLFYQSGVGIRGYASVTSAEGTSEADLPVLNRYGLGHLKVRLGLTNETIFDRAVPIGPMVERLDFVSNKVHWGHSVRTSPRSISDKDFATIRDAAQEIAERSS